MLRSQGGRGSAARPGDRGLSPRAAVAGTCFGVPLSPAGLGQEGTGASWCPPPLEWPRHCREEEEGEPSPRTHLQMFNPARCRCGEHPRHAPAELSSTAGPRRVPARVAFWWHLRHLLALSAARCCAVAGRGPLCRSARAGRPARQLLPRVPGGCPGSPPRCRERGRGGWRRGHRPSSRRDVILSHPQPWRVEFQPLVCSRAAGTARGSSSPGS